MKTQVDSSHYLNIKHNSLERFSSYQLQIEYCLKLKPKMVLEIGIGNRILSNFLKSAGLNVTTCDFDKKLSPDVVADIRKLPFKERSFDLIIACQILEHIPYEDVPNVLASFHKIVRKNVIISIPYNTFNLYGIAKLFPFIKPVRFLWRLFEYSIIKHNKNVGTKEHYWEMGKKGYTRTKIRELIRKAGFKIIKEDSPYLNPGHYFFILEK